MHKKQIALLWLEYALARENSVENKQTREVCATCASREKYDGEEQVGVRVCDECVFWNERERVAESNDGDRGTWYKKDYLQTGHILNN